MSEKPRTRLKVLSKKIGLSDQQLAMCLLYCMTHDKVFSWKQTIGINSNSNHPAQAANNHFNSIPVKKFFEQMGGIMAWKAEDYLTFRGNNKPIAKKITAITNKHLYKASTDAIDPSKIEDIGKLEQINSEIDKIYEEDNKSTDRQKLTNEKKENNLPIININDIQMKASMSRTEFLDYLIQEQGKCETQKDKNLFTLKIHEHMNFKEDKSNELRPIWYLPFRFEDIGLCDKCSALIRSYTK